MGLFCFLISEVVMVASFSKSTKDLANGCVQSLSLSNHQIMSQVETRLIFW